MTDGKTLKRRTLEIRAAEGRDAEAVTAATIAGPELASAAVMTDFAVGMMGDTSLTKAVEALRANGKAIIGNDMSSAEAMLASQASALNTMFGELARRAAQNMDAHMQATDAYMRMALKAQNQCRMTLETLATIKNPPVVFAKQANISNGPQQVNNGVPVATGARENLPAPNKLLEHQHVERMDARTASAAGGSDTPMATLEPVNRAENKTGKSGGLPQRRQGRKA